MLDREHHPRPTIGQAERPRRELMAYQVTAIIRPHRLEDVRQAIHKVGVIGLTVAEVQGYGRQGGKTEMFRGTEYSMHFVPKVKVEVIVSDADVDAMVDAIASTARTGKIGDGKLWAFPLDRLVRIRTGEEGDDAV
jgi:nitrogen regulatory protein P-II 1